MNGCSKIVIPKLLRRNCTLLIVVLICLLPAFICGQIANFPLQDDHFYVWSIQNFCHSGKIKFLATSPTCVLDVLLGAPIWQASGGSFAALHLISISWVFAMAIGCYKILRELHRSRQLALIAATIFCVNPIIVNLSITYMTEPSALALTTWAIYFCQRGISSARIRDWLLCVGFVMLALACRQTALLLVPALFVLSITLILCKRRDGVILALLLISTVPFYFFLDHFVLVNTIYTQPVLTYKKKLVETATHLLSGGTDGIRFSLLAIAKIFCYLGFYLLPVLAAHLPGTVATKERRAILSVSVLGAACVTALPLVLAFQERIYMPYCFGLMCLPYVGDHCIFQNFVTNWAGTQQVLFTVFFIACGILFSLMFWFSFQIFCVSVIKSLMHFRFRSRSKPPTNNSNQLRFTARQNLFYIFISTLFLVSLVLLVMQAAVQNFDRYQLIILLPSLLCCVYAQRALSTRFKPAVIFGAVLTFCLYTYSNLALWEYTEFNRCRWSLIRTLEAKGIGLAEIDGGPECCLTANPTLFGDELKYSPNWIDEWPETARGGAEQAPFRWWPVTKTTYIVTDRGFRGYQTMLCRRYFSAIDWRWKTMLLLRRS
jgi:hypothetical protein